MRKKERFVLGKRTFRSQKSKHFVLRIIPIVRSKLESHGILYVGDLIQLNEEYLMEIWGLGPVALERIKTKLNENGVWFGMDVIRINDRWYRRKQELTTD